jgi:hypothetical protein
MREKRQRLAFAASLAASRYAPQDVGDLRRVELSSC